MVEKQRKEDIKNMNRAALKRDREILNTCREDASDRKSNCRNDKEALAPVKKKVRSKK